MVASGSAVSIPLPPGERRLRPSVGAVACDGSGSRLRSEVVLSTCAYRMTMLCCRGLPRQEARGVANAVGSHREVA